MSISVNNQVSRNIEEECREGYYPLIPSAQYAEKQAGNAIIPLKISNFQFPQTALPTLSSNPGETLLKKSRFSHPNANLSSSEVELDDDKKRINNTQKVDSKPQIDPSSSGKLPIDIEIEHALRALKALERKYKSFDKDIIYSEKFLEKDVSNKIKYINANKENILQGILLVSPEQYDDAKSWLNDADKKYKLTDSLASLIIQVYHHCFVHDVQKKLAQHQQQYQKFVEAKKKESSFSNNEQLKVMEKIMDQLHQRLEDERQETSNKVIEKVADFSTRASSIPFEKIGQLPEKTASKISKCTFGIFKNIWAIWDVLNTRSIQDEWLSNLKPFVVNIYSGKEPTVEERKLIEERQSAQQQLYKDSEAFLASLANCKTIDEMKAQCKKLKIPLNLSPMAEPSEILSNPRFKREILESYFYYTGRRQAFRDPGTIKSFLLAKEIEQNKKVDRALVLMAKEIQECRDLSWPEIQAHFAKIGVDLKEIKLSKKNQSVGLPVPPETEAEWGTCTQSDIFCRALAEIWVREQETIAILLMQGLRQALLRKHEVERKFLNFRGIHHGVGLLFNAIQLALCTPYAKLFAVSSIIEYFFTDLSKLGIPSAGVVYVCYPFYPEITFKIEAISMLLAKRFFAVQYKPKEYSFESYKLTVQNHIFECALTAHSLLFLTKQALLWLNMRLIEHCILGIKTNSFYEDKRYIQMKEELEQKRVDCQTRIQNLKNILEDFKIEDAKLIVQPQMQNVAFNQAKVNPFKDLADALQKGDVDYFPPYVVEFIESHTRVKLTNAQKENFQKDLETFFTESESSFIKAYDSNRFAYLRV